MKLNKKAKSDNFIDLTGEQFGNIRNPSEILMHILSKYDNGYAMPSRGPHANHVHAFSPYEERMMTNRKMNVMDVLFQRAVEMEKANNPYMYRKR